jgi:hypothetical protein
MNRPPLADRQERAAAVLEALPPELAQRGPPAPRRPRHGVVRIDHELLSR